MKQTLQLKLSQHLALTPQLQQSIRLLQLSTLELNQELERFLAENPLLEREEAPAEPAVRPPSGGESAAAGPAQGEASETGPPAEDWPLEPDWLMRAATPTGFAREDEDEHDPPQLAAESPSLREHLRSQLALIPLSERDRNLVAFLIEALDEAGYLTQPLEELAALLPPELAVEVEELQVALRHLQNLDPTGVGARNCAECLELQLRALPETTPARALALAIVREHLELLAARDYTRLKKLLRCGDDELRAAQRLVQSLNPRPASAYAPLEARYVVPDVIVKKMRGVWTASLNSEAVPKLRINRLYAEILQNRRERSASRLSQQLQEARWLIRNVQQRFETILRVSQAIVDRQRNFFEHGEIAMRPLVLREIASVLGLHESTVSRVTNQKYMLTPRGLYELKYFFGSHVTTEAGGAASSTAIRALIRQLVAAEDAKKPLSDSRIAAILGEQGIVVARRTVAKYRELLSIPPANMRKSL